LVGPGVDEFAANARNCMVIVTWGRRSIVLGDACGEDQHAGGEGGSS